MFGRKKKNGIEVTRLSSLIADNLHIVGDVHFSGGLRIDGHVEGNVFGKPGTKGLLVLSEKGVITGKVHTHDAVINGNITGDLDVEHFAELQVNAKVVGNVRYRQLQMDCGSSVEGKLVRIHDVAAERSAARVEVPPPARPAAAALRGDAAPMAGAASVAPRPAAPVAPRSDAAGATAALDKDKLTASR
ncbi:MAG: polymer-forming cytoskeletal protein [Pseudazoarcus pumilus]|nr:polymer-forming cytoskeletal protein [Pseudazoarcus pumilus]